MRRLKLIGIGAGNPDYITVQAINALGQVDAVFVTDKGDDTADLLRARREVCERYMQAKPYRIIEIQDPERDRNPAAYRSAVTAWHEKRAALYAHAIREQLSEDECGAFLVWGDPSLYDSTLRIIDQVAALRTVDFEWEIIPGITSIQALAARHRISLNEIGEPVHITTGRRLTVEQPADGALRLGTYRPFWASREVEISPALHFTIARQQLELSPEDARRLGISGGDTVEVSQNGTRLRAKAVVRSGVSAGTAFLAEGIADDSANALTGGEIEVGKR